jgi:hypothetical protein
MHVLSLLEETDIWCGVMELDHFQFCPISSDVELVEAFVSSSLAEYVHGISEELRLRSVLVAPDWALVGCEVHSGDAESGRLSKLLSCL